MRQSYPVLLIIVIEDLQPYSVDLLKSEISEWNGNDLKKNIPPSVVEDSVPLIVIMSFDFNTFCFYKDRNCLCDYSECTGK